MKKIYKKKNETINAEKILSILLNEMLVIRPNYYDKDAGDIVDTKDNHEAIEFPKEVIDYLRALVYK